MRADIFRIRNRSIPVFALLSIAVALFGCASTKPGAEDVDDASLAQVDALEEPTDSSIESEADNFPDETDATQASADQCTPPENTREQAAQSGCVIEPGPNEALLDRTQRTVFEVANSTTRWFDGFFGETPLNAGDHVSRGRMTVSGYLG